MRKWIFIIALSLGFNIPACLPQSLQFKNINVSDGLLSSTVYHVFQDSKGFIWFATMNGVNRYDGKTFETFTTENGLSDNEVFKITEDSYGRIWFLTYNGKLSYFLDGAIYNPTNSALLKRAICHSNFVSFFEDSRHTLWFSTNGNEVISIRNEEVKCYTTDDSNSPLNDLIFFEDDYKNLWSVNNVRFHHVKYSGFTLARQKYYPVDVRSTYFDKPSQIFYFICDDGVVAMQNGIQKLIKKIPPSLVSKGISSIIVEGNKIWITMLGSGVKVFNLANDHFEDYLKDKFVSSIIKDRDRNIWISTLDDGVFLLSKKATNFNHYTYKNPLTDEAVYSIAKDNENNIWLGLRNGQINVLSDNKIKILDFKLDDNAYNPIRQLYFNAAYRNIWLLSNNTIGKIIDLNKTNQLQIISNVNQHQFSLKSFSFSSTGNLAISAATGLYILKSNYDEDGFQIKKKDLLSINIKERTFCASYDKNNNLWYDQLNGLHILKNQKIFSFSKKIGALSDRITHIFCDDYGLVYASTSSHGICIFKDDELVKIITTKDGLYSDNCVKTYVFNHVLWVLNSKGVNKIENALGEIKCTGYNKENGLLTNEVNDILVDNDFVYLATNKGLTIVKNSEEISYSPDLPLYFKKLLVSGVEYEIGDKPIELPPGENNIQLSFTAINYEEPDKIMFGYRIKSNDNWVETPNNNLEFASLEPGNYNIQIRAKDLNGNWGKSIDLMIIVDTPFYKTYIFLLTVILLIIFAALFIFNKYIKNKRKKENEKTWNQAKIVALEQQALQAMMNPHFIFNVMNSIQYFINTQDKQTANQLLTGFARLIRKNMDIVNKGEISLAEEIEYLKLYLQLESLRFGKKLNYSLNIENGIETEDILIPSMLLQPFIENAIWHGIMPKETEGNIIIKILQQHQLLKIIIEDDGVGIDHSKKIKTDEYISRGMSITQERISLINQLAGSEMNIQIGQRPEGGTIVKIHIPISLD